MERLDTLGILSSCWCFLLYLHGIAQSNLAVMRGKYLFCGHDLFVRVHMYVFHSSRLIMLCVGAFLPWEGVVLQLYRVYSINSRGSSTSTTDDTSLVMSSVSIVLICA